MTKILLTIPLILFVCACQTVSSVPKYSVIIKNGTANTFAGASVNYGAFESGGGYIPPGNEKGYEFVPVSIPEKATVVWRTMDGTAHEQIVDVLKVLPNGFHDGDIIFTVKEDGHVTVTNEPYLKL
jgi:hypothetical protein